MPTDKSKISAYVSDDLSFVFQNFCKEKEVSQSKGVTLLFEEYFKHLGEKYLESLPEDNELRLRLQGLREKTGGLFNGSRDELLNKVENLLIQVNLLTERVEKLEKSGLQSTSISSSLSDTSKSNEESEASVVNLPETSQQSEPLSEILLSESNLIKRFGISGKRFSHLKGSARGRGFNKQSRDVDPDNIPWKRAKRRDYYTPSVELNNELKSRLLLWITENINLPDV